MEKGFARKLVKDALQHSFEKERFTYLVRNLLNKIEETPETTYRGSYIRDAFRDHIKTLDRIGKYQDPDGKKLDILVVHLKKTTGIEHARTMQRNFIAWYLNGSRGGVEKDAALVAFIARGEDDWRFSFVKMEYKFVETPKGHKAQQDFTPARRYSFLVGENENSHTAQRQLVPFLLDDDHRPKLNQLEEAFSIEKVTKEFFEKYRELFLKLKESLDELVKKDSQIKADFKEKSVDTVDFCKKLLGQIVFLYFLQKKGWFGVERGKPWNSGSKRFLRELFDQKQPSYQYNNFFNDILEPLFYEALRYEREGDYYSRFDCRIPFLNGGLFDPIAGYDWIDTEILFPNELFSNDFVTKEGDIGTGILDVFDRYNFTVKEDEPLDKEVAIDPEMLGKVFENLLEVKDRKSKGTYYTPREIVHYMCQQSLINYLDTTVNTAKKPITPEKAVQNKLFGKPEPQQLSLSADGYETVIPRKDLEFFTQHGQSALEHDKRVEAEGRETKTYSYRMPELIRENAEAVDNALKNIRICDPAIGSGAFPVGMMHEIVNARNVLSTYLNGSENRTPYEFKRHAIQSCLYGVDIDPSAVEIAKLRLWLSLIVDEDDIKQIKPLPNLDYKVVCGNSLLGVEKDLWNERLFAKLEQLKPLYFNETNVRKKQKYKNEIDSLIEQLTHNSEIFDFEIYFSEVFHEKGGFDLVIGNPPYRQIQKCSKAQKKVWQEQGFQTFTKTGDIYCLFYEKGSQLLAPNAVLCFITSNSWLRTKYGNLLRKYFLEKVNPLMLLNFEDAQLFESAIVEANVLIIQKSHWKKHLEATNVTEKLAHYVSISVFFENNKVTLSKLDQNAWTIGSQTEILLKQKIEWHSKLLKELNVSINRGLTIGFSKAFIINKQTRDELIAKDAKNREIIKPLLRGRDIKKYTYEHADLFLIVVKSGFTNSKRGCEDPNKYFEGHYKDLYFHLKTVGDTQKGKGKGLYHRDDQGDYWWELRKCAYYQDFEKEKMIWIVLSDTGKFAYDDRGFYINDSCFMMTGEGLKYLLAILNSNLAEWYFAQISTSSGMGTNMWKKYKIEMLPIRDIPIREQRPFINMVDKVLAVTKKDDYLENPAKQAKVKELEKQIEQMVYKLYGLTPDEIDIVEGRSKTT